MIAIIASIVIYIQCSEAIVKSPVLTRLPYNAIGLITLFNDLMGSS